MKLSKSASLKNKIQTLPKASVCVLSALKQEVRANTEEQKEAYRAKRKAEREGRLADMDDDDDFDEDDVEIIYASKDAINPKPYIKPM